MTQHLDISITVHEREGRQWITAKAYADRGGRYGSVVSAHVDVDPAENLADPETCVAVLLRCASALVYHT